VTQSYAAKIIDVGTEAAVGAIIDAGGTIDYRVQPVVTAVLTAVIAALMEPSPAMLKAGNDAIEPDERFFYKRVADDVFSAMLSQLQREISAPESEG
jgi:hypothetical protein